MEKRGGGRGGVAKNGGHFEMVIWPLCCAEILKGKGVAHGANRSYTRAAGPISDVKSVLNVVEAKCEWQLYLTVSCSLPGGVRGCSFFQCKHFIAGPHILKRRSGHGLQFVVFD